MFETVMKQNITVQLCGYNEFLPYQSYGKFYQPKANARKAILDSLKDPKQSIEDACQAVYDNQTIKERIVRNLKYILALFPVEVTNSIKKLLSKTHSGKRARCC